MSLKIKLKVANEESLKPGGILKDGNLEKFLQRAPVVYLILTHGPEKVVKVITDM